MCFDGLHVLAKGHTGFITLRRYIALSTSSPFLPMNLIDFKTYHRKIVYLTWVLKCLCTKKSIILQGIFSLLSYSVLLSRRANPLLVLFLQGNFHPALEAKRMTLIYYFHQLILKKKKKNCKRTLKLSIIYSHRSPHMDHRSFPYYCNMMNPVLIKKEENLKPMMNYFKYI